MDKGLGDYEKIRAEFEIFALSNPNPSDDRTKYEKTEVQLYMGDQWYCTEKEAIKAGYVKATDCFEKNYQIQTAAGMIGG